MDITRPSGDADGYSAEIAVILGTACPGHCHGSHASTGCGAHWHMVPAPSAWSPQCLCPLCPGFPWLTLHTMVTPERAVQYFTRTLQPCMCRGEARSVTRGVTTCSCSGERCYLVRRRSGDVTQGCKPWQLSIETLLNGCTTQLTIVWSGEKKGLHFVNKSKGRNQFFLK